MDPITIGLLAGSGIGLLKGDQDEKNYQEKMRLAAETQRWSPWTHMQAQMPDSPDAMGSLLAGAGAGAAMGQSVGNAGAGAAAPSTNGPGGALSKSPYSAMGPNQYALGHYQYKTLP